MLVQHKQGFVAVGHVWFSKVYSMLKYTLLYYNLRFCGFLRPLRYMLKRVSFNRTCYHILCTSHSSLPAYWADPESFVLLSKEAVWRQEVTKYLLVKILNQYSFSVSVDGSSLCMVNHLERIVGLLTQSFLNLGCSASIPYADSSWQGLGLTGPAQIQRVAAEQYQVQEDHKVIWLRKSLGLNSSASSTRCCFIYHCLLIIIQWKKIQE